MIERRGPYLLADERELLRSFRTTTLVTKDSGGDYTRPKLDAAAELGVRIVIVRRPEPASVGTASEPESVATLDEAVQWAVAASC